MKDDTGVKDSEVLRVRKEIEGLEHGITHYAFESSTNITAPVDPVWPSLAPAEPVLTSPATTPSLEQITYEDLFNDMILWPDSPQTTSHVLGTPLIPGSDKASSLELLNVRQSTSSLTEDLPTSPNAHVTGSSNIEKGDRNTNVKRPSPQESDSASGPEKSPDSFDQSSLLSSPKPSK